MLFILLFQFVYKVCSCLFVVLGTFRGRNAFISQKGNYLHMLVFVQKGPYKLLLSLFISSFLPSFHFFLLYLPYGIFLGLPRRS